MQEGTHAKGSQKGGRALVFSRFTIQASASCWCGYRGFTISAAAGISARGPSSVISAQIRKSSDCWSFSLCREVLHYRGQAWGVEGAYV